MGAWRITTTTKERGGMMDTAERIKRIEKNREKLRALPQFHEDVTWLIERVQELEKSFDLRWEADMRAIKKWQEAGGDELTWPDHADLCVCLMEQNDKKGTVINTLYNALDRACNCMCAREQDLETMRITNEATKEVLDTIKEILK